ncbi:MAG: glycosyltransferase family 2 protein [Bacteroidetes bacterium]|nr:glycosyltransferase family 2 protein [Bacteroidota bacterium]
MQKNNPLVSVVIPAYNVEKFIGETLRSVLNQTYNNYEIIVVDDSSRDQTASVVNQFIQLDKRIKYFKIEHSGRPAVPRNFGISKASGELIAFLDSDDLWKKNKLAEQVLFLEKYPGLIFIYSMSVTFGDVNLFSPFYEVLPLLNKAARTKEDLLKKGNSITCSSVLIRSDYLKKVNGFDEDPKLKAVEDYDLWIRLSEFGKFGFIPRIHTYYRVHSSQSSSDWETKQKRLEYLSSKRNIDLPKYHFYRNKGFPIRIARNSVHFLTFLYVKFLSLINRGVSQ